jgi:CubicO group peptidase (beta-lactamase class C family)
VLLIILVVFAVIFLRRFSFDSTSATAPPAPVPWLLPEEFVTGAAGDAQLADVLERIRVANNLPALAAVIADTDGVIEMAAVGQRAAGFPEPVSLTDQWHLGSISKPLTATLAARLIEKGVLAWDTTIGDVFPELRNTMEPAYQAVRLDELLHHASGLPRDLTPEEYLHYAPDIPARAQRRGLVAQILALPPANPRGAVLYSNVGYIVAGAMLEARADMDFEALMTREVFEPLGMERAGFGPPGTPGRRDQPWGHFPALRLPGAADLAEGIWGTRATEYIAAGQAHRGAWQPLDPGRPAADNYPFAAASGRVHASLEDMARFAAAHLAASRGDTPFLTAASAGKLHTPPDDSGIALDWAVSTRDWAWGRWLYHSGSTARWYAALTLAPDRGVAIFAAANASGLTDEGNRGTDQAAQALIRRMEAAASSP